MDDTRKRITVRTLAEMKRERRRIVMVTAYDAIMARWAEDAGCHLILVGDSMGNTVLGYENTIPVTLEESLILTAAVCRGRSRAMVVGDMPFLSYQVSPQEAVRNAGRYLKETGADAVKLEGGEAMASVVGSIVAAGIPVMGHVGLMPQSVLKDGGYHLHGKGREEAEALKRDAQAVQAAGAFAVVLEGIPGTLAAEITAGLEIPTIGIAAGPDCDGQVQVVTDILAMGAGRIPRHAKVYAEIGRMATAAIESYRREVEDGSFPPR